MRKYPTSLQDFEGIIKEGYVYVDKTEYIHKMTSQGKYFFLSRPRRFGKSMLTTTIQALFEGKKDLFKGLYIQDKWDWDTTNPVIRLSFAEIGYEGKGLKSALLDRLKEFAQTFEIQIDDEDLSSYFRLLIKGIAEKHGHLVLLIDEYDKPINHYLGKDEDLAVKNRDIMKSFYSVLKDADQYLRLLFITGVSKFAKVSIFSDLNNLQDLTFNDSFSGVCGITEHEMLSNFNEELAILDKSDIKKWYNGYTWDLKVWVYNPFSLINYFNEQKFKIFWFESGTPTFLINLLKDRVLYNFTDIEVNLLQLSSFDITNIDTVTLMYQTGYLTFADYDEISMTYFLKFPNMEVERSFNELLLHAYTVEENTNTSISLVSKLRRALVDGNLEMVPDYLNTLYKSIPYTIWEKHSESYFQAILHLTFKLLGYQVSSEVMLSDGRVDSIVEVADKVYAIEIKLDGAASSAIQQIKDKGYLEAHRLKGKKLVGVGINFSSKEKKIIEFMHELF
jgi:hypothetical protein